MKRLYIMILFFLLVGSAMQAEGLEQERKEKSALLSLNEGEIARLFLTSEQDPLVLLGAAEKQLLADTGSTNHKGKNTPQLTTCVTLVQNGNRLISSKLFTAALEELLFESRNVKDAGVCYKNVMDMLDCVYDYSATFQFGDQKAERIVRICDGLKHSSLEEVEREFDFEHSARGQFNVLVQDLKPAQCVNIRGALIVDTLRTDLLALGVTRGKTVIPATFADCLAFNTGNIGDTHYFGAVKGTGIISNVFGGSLGKVSRGVRIEFSEAPTTGTYVKLIVIGTHEDNQNSAFFTTSYFFNPNEAFEVYTDNGTSTEVVNFADADFPNGTGQQGIVAEFGASPPCIEIRFNGGNTSTLNNILNPIFIYKIVGKNVESVKEATGDAFSTAF